MNETTQVSATIETGEQATATVPQLSNIAQFKAMVKADHHAMVSGREKYQKANAAAASLGLKKDGIQKIGFQMMIAVRAMRVARDCPIPLGGQIMSRLIRHIYGAEIHWDAEFGGGIALIHGVGLVISHGSKIGEGCILFQGVTLGESINSQTRVVGSPTIGNNVHIGPGAVLLGPITIGDNCKIMANCVVDCDVPANSVVRAPSVSVISR